MERVERAGLAEWIRGGLWSVVRTVRAWLLLRASRDALHVTLIRVMGGGVRVSGTGTPASVVWRLSGCGTNAVSLTNAGGWRGRGEGQSAGNTSAVRATVGRTGRCFFGRRRWMMRCPCANVDVDGGVAVDVDVEGDVERGVGANAEGSRLCGDGRQAAAIGGVDARWQMADGRCRGTQTPAADGGCARLGSSASVLAVPPAGPCWMQVIGRRSLASSKWSGDVDVG